MLFAQTNTAAFFDFLAKNKDAFDSLQSIATVAGIVVAGIWTYMLFVRKREKYPRADLKHRIEFWDISERERLVRVVLVVKNESDTLLRLFHGRTWIQQMKPWPIEVIEQYKEASEESAEASVEVGWLLISEKKHDQERERSNRKNLMKSQWTSSLIRATSKYLSIPFLKTIENPGGIWAGPLRRLSISPRMTGLCCSKFRDKLNKSRDPKMPHQRKSRNLAERVSEETLCQSEMTVRDKDSRSRDLNLPNNP